MKLKVSLLTVAVMKLKAAANVDMHHGSAKGIASGNLMENLGCQLWDVDLKVYVKPYSVFTGVCLCFKLLYQLYYNFIKSHTYMF